MTGRIIHNSFKTSKQQKNLTFQLFTAFENMPQCRKMVQRLTAGVPRLQRYFSAAVTVLSLLALAGCELLDFGGDKTVASHALPASFEKRLIATSPFPVTASERVRTPGQVAAVYIEGDGNMALGLASQDVTANVFYLGSPCAADDSGCIESLSAALDDIKSRYRIFGFNLVGFSGGAASAALLAAARDDVLSLRTVAGKLDSVTGVAEKILHLPQKHFVDPKDPTAAKFVEATHRPDCVSLTPVAGSWTVKWPELLEQPLEGGCQ